MGDTRRRPNENESGCPSATMRFPGGLLPVGTLLRRPRGCRVYVEINPGCGGCVEVEELPNTNLLRCIADSASNLSAVP